MRKIGSPRALRLQRVCRDATLAAALLLAGCGSQRFGGEDWGYGPTGSVPRSSDYAGNDRRGGEGDFDGSAAPHGGIRRGGLAPLDGYADGASVAPAAYGAPDGQAEADYGAPLPNGRVRGRRPGYLGGDGGDGPPPYGAIAREAAPYRDGAASYAPRYDTPPAEVGGGYSPQDYPPSGDGAQYAPRGVPGRGYSAVRGSGHPGGRGPGSHITPASYGSIGAGEQGISHDVGPGDSLFALSRRYNTSVDAIGAANGLSHGETLQPGRKLVIPARPRYAEAAPTGEGFAPRYDEPTIVSDAYPPRRGGATLPAPPSPRAPLGGGAPAASPAPAPPPAAARDQAPGTADFPTPAADERLAAAKPDEARPDIALQSAAAPEIKDCSENEESPLPRSSDKFREPVSGAIISAFGQATDGQVNDGINYAVPRGTPVKAAENGIVIYTGNELAGFGNLILVRHDGGYVSAYGHNDEMLVKRCQVIKRGETIAKAGATGSVSKPQLHFELRKDQKPVNPQLYFAAK